MTTPTLPALATTDLPLTSAMSGDSIAHPRFLKLLNDSIAAGAVPNVTHTELKQHFRRAIETLWERHVAAPYFYGQGDQGATPRELLDFFMSASPTLREKLVRDPENRAAVQAGTAPRSAQHEEYVLKPDFKAALVALAEKDAAELREAFISKVVRKLAPIVEAKGNLASVTEVSNTIQVGRMSGMLAIAFTDGSRFVVDNNLVYSSSVRNREFMRFPLTFHDVILADGIRMKKPSEERMHSIFCAGGELAQDGRQHDHQHDHQQDYGQVDAAENEESEEDLSPRG